MPIKLRGISQRRWKIATREAEEFFSPEELAYIRGYIVGCFARDEMPTINEFVDAPSKRVQVGVVQMLPWQIRHLAQGKCILCDFKRYFPSKRCKYHVVYTRRYYRNLGGHKAWKPGAFGQAPIEVMRKLMTKEELKEGMKKETAFWKQEWKKTLAQREAKKIARKQAAEERRLAKLIRGRPNRKIPKVPGVSRQRAWQLQQEREGKCADCNEPRFMTSKFCKKHLIASRERGRKLGYKAWHPGGMGRIPLEAKFQSPKEENNQ